LATEPLVTLSDPVQENAKSSIIRFSDAFFLHSMEQTRMQKQKNPEEKDKRISGHLEQINLYAAGIPPCQTSCRIS
jgi:hypothetical protein